MATNQFLMLEEISMDYHAFRKDQVLTEKQLNDIIHYFEDQDRMSRTYLVGVGLVCGLVLSFENNPRSISISKGCGVTTDGDLLWMEPTTFHHFKAYSNRKKGTNDPIYDPFWPGGAQIPLWELVIPDEHGELPLESKPLTSFTAGTQQNLGDMVALLYLEYYLQDPDKCSAIDCDNQGPHQIANIKVLLLAKEDMEQVINRDPAAEEIADSIYKNYHQGQQSQTDLPVLKAKRIILNSTNTANPTMLAKDYLGAAKLGAANLIAAIQKLYGSYQFILDANQQQNIVLLINKLSQALEAQVPIYLAQYVYDFYKDIIVTYNELRAALSGCLPICCPDKFAFPKHIMLGEVNKSGSIPAPYRHEFYPSPAVTSCRDGIKRSKSLWLRLIGMIQRFQATNQPRDIRITPSLDYKHLLEHRAIPYYFKEVAGMIDHWNYQLSRKGLQKHNLSYHANQYGFGIDSTLNPLEYDIDKNDFYRVEGHLGQPLATAFSNIIKSRDEHSLAFDIIALRINKSGNIKDININDFDCQFEDLQAILKAFLVEQNCLYASVTKFFSGFNSNRNKGFHSQLTLYTAVPYQYMAVAANNSSLGLISEEPNTGGNTAHLRINTNINSLETGTEKSPGGLNINTNMDDTSVKSRLSTNIDKDQPFCKTVYVVDKTVNDNLVVENEAIGIYMAGNPYELKYSAENYIMQLKEATAGDERLALLSDDEKLLVYEAPIYVIANIAEASQLRPFDIIDINEDLLGKYINRMKVLCKYAKTLRARLDNILNKSTYTRNGFESYYIFILQQLIANCCAAEKLESLLEEIQRRKKKILDSLLFANYAKAHPGLEHKAGVHRGGTFVLVYANEYRDKGIDFTRATNFAARGNEDTLNLRAPISDIEEFAYYLVSNQGKINFEKEVDNYKKEHRIKTGSLEEQQFDKTLLRYIKEICARLNREEEAALADNLVVADFTLPYLCCSDCPPMTFILPRETYNLSLPKATACSDEEPLLFQRQPATGTVKTTDALKDTITVEGNNVFFNPAKVPASTLGQPISFTIDDQVTNCKITVYKHPQAAFTYEIIELNDKELKVEFHNQSNEDSGDEFVYDWDFGDGRAVERKTNREVVPVTYNREVLKRLKIDGNIPIKLNAINSGCSDSAEDNVQYEVSGPVSLSLPVNVICHDSNPVAFTVSPTNGEVKATTEEKSVEKIGDNQYQFNPSLVANYGTAIHFTVNGEATDCQVTVYKRLTANFSVTNINLIPGSPFLEATFNNLSNPGLLPGYTYHWKFGDGQAHSSNNELPFTMRFNYQNLIAQGLKSIPVTLEVVNPSCGSSKQGTVPLPTGEQPNTCSQLVKEQATKDLQYFSSARVLKALNSIQGTAEYKLLLPVVTETQNILNAVNSSTFDINLPSNQVKLYRRIIALLKECYASNFSDGINQIIVTYIIRSMIELSINLVKCTDKVDNNSKEMLMAILKTFLGEIPKSIKEKFGSINGKNVLGIFIEEYLSSKAWSDNELEKLIKEILDKLKSLPV
ncbi:hypothetical protein COR50_15045 [Chitinophaga caeni]|uniref:PKD domain-containing protein n=1 Tax=Chitinophaga caeni TaxID=2029983 RepID=A0A291QWS7_9BACT|nr:hypothetical protein [Chitinophaga caeni]ATL48371.1 hypothetical protein COR50_15045 [Chitinophaga caeni]